MTQYACYLKKKRWIFFLFVLIVCSGCAKKTITEEKRVRPSSKHGGIVVFSTSSDPRSFNAIVSNESSTSEAISYIFDGMTRTNGVTGDVEPSLAERWEYSEDGLVWTFYLRNDVVWFDGVPFTADDVVFTFNDLIYNPSIPSSMRDLLTIDGQKFEIRKMDMYTVEVRTPVPYAPLLRHIGVGILPRHRLIESVEGGTFPVTWGVDTPPEEIIGTGPYRLTEYVPAQKLVYKRNENYWRKDRDGFRLPYIDQIVTIIVPDDNVQIAKFQAREVDSLRVRPKDYAYVKSIQQKGNFTIYDLGPAFGSTFIMFNQDQTVIDPVMLEWFRDRNFRKAVAYAIDRETIINNVYSGLGVAQVSPVSKADPIFHNADVRSYAYDPEKAKNLLKESGYVDSNQDGFLEKPEGHPVKFMLITNSNNSERKDMALIVTENLRAIGMDVTYRTLDFNNLVQKLDGTGEWESMILGLGGGNLEPHGGKNVWDPSGRLHMWNRKLSKDQYSKKEREQSYDAYVQSWEDHLPDWEWRILELFNQGVQELVEEKRKVYYYEWQDIVAEELPLIYLVTPKNYMAVRNKFIGLKPSNFAGVFHNFDELYLEDEYL